MIVVVVDKIKSVWNFVIFAKKFLHAKLIFATLLSIWIKIRVQFCAFSFLLKNAVWIKCHRHAHSSNSIAIKVYNCLNSYVVKLSKNNDVLLEKTCEYKILTVRLLKSRISMKKKFRHSTSRISKKICFMHHTSLCAHDLRSRNSRTCMIIIVQLNSFKE